MEREKVMTASKTGDEREGKNVNVGGEGSNSNGHGKEMDKEEHMMHSSKDCRKMPRLV
jgi:hypothetical protein